MINPFDYLYYKINKMWDYFDNLFLLPIGTMYVILLLNFVTILLLLNDEKSKFDNVLAYGVWGLLVFVTIFYGASKRTTKIEKKYQKESEKSREIGNFIIGCYITLTIVAFIFAVRYSKK